MSTLTAAEADVVWGAIDVQRVRVADLLERLTPEQLDRPSLCDGWTVRHVAAHLTLQQEDVRSTVSFVAHNPVLLRHPGLNATIHHSALVQAQRLTMPQIVARIRGMVGSRRHNVFVTPLETLTDVLVHGQDIAVPLGIELPVDPAAAARSAARVWDVRGGWMGRVNRRLPLEGYRLTATDTGWERGQGPAVAGPTAALLLLLTGRPAGLDRLTGDGAAALRGA